MVDTVRLAPEEESLKLTGYEHNGVTCVGMKTDIPVILVTGVLFAFFAPLVPSCRILTSNNTLGLQGALFFKWVFCTLV